MKRKLFCEISPFTYKISVLKCRCIRRIKNLLSGQKFANEKSGDKLPFIIYKHNSLIRRTLGNVDIELQNNKAVNLAIACPKVDGIIIKPGEVFSFWHLVGSTTERKGYKAGLTISNAATSKGIGGGMCQFTNLIHWMILHTPLDIVEHHHHDGFDLFPDFNRKVPFGTGTSIVYNYLDYRFKNNTDKTFQLIVYVTDTHLCGELRADGELENTYHIETENEHFIKIGDDVFRKGKVYRNTTDKRKGNTLKRELIRENHAKVMYDTTNLEIRSLI